MRKDGNWVEHAGEAGLAHGVEKRRRPGKKELFFGINQESCAKTIQRGRRSEIMSAIIISAARASAERRNYRCAVHCSPSCPSFLLGAVYGCSRHIPPRIGRFI